MKKVLVVDDSSFLRMTLHKALESRYKFQVIEACNGLQAIELYKKEHPYLVTLDVLMPELNGMEALKRILEYDPKANIIMCTEAGEIHLVINSANIGAKGFVVKPLVMETLYNIIDGILSESK